MAKFELPENPDVAIVIVETQAKQKEKLMQVGILGLLFGDLKDKPGNIAGLAILISFAMLVAVLFISPDNPNIPRSEIVTLFGGIITLALGFLFGRSWG